MLYSDRPLVDTDSVDEAWATLAGKGLGFAPNSRSDGEDFRATLYCAQYPELHFASTAFHTTAMLEMYEGREHFAVMAPFTGAFQVQCGQQTIVTNTGELAVFSPSEHLSLTQGRGCERFTVYVPWALLHERLELMLGEPIECPLVFDPAPNSFRNGGGFLKGSIDHVFHAFSNGASLNDVTRESYDQFMESLLDHMLHSLRHNYSSALTMQVPVHGMPGDVTRALEYIHAHPSRDVSMKTLVEIAGVPGRTLMHHFKHFLGTSPVRYSRDLRFTMAREDLEKANGGDDTITGIAQRWGFRHMGRFSTDYRTRFGETPTQTRLAP